MELQEWDYVKIKNSNKIAYIECIDEEYTTVCYVDKKENPLTIMMKNKRLYSIQKKGCC